MYLSKLFSRTLHEAPADVESAGYKLLFRAGFIRPLAAGIFCYLPLGFRTLQNFNTIARGEIEAIGGQEVSLPLVQPKEIWRKCGWGCRFSIETGQFTDQAQRELILASTNEAVFADLVRREIRSYRQLPALIYQIQTAWRDRVRCRGGLLQPREFSMVNSFSIDQDLAGLEQQYENHVQAFRKVFQRCQIPVREIPAETNSQGAAISREFVYLSAGGDETVLSCEKCGYAANQKYARVRKSSPQAESARPLEKVATPASKTIEEVAAYLNVPKDKTAKAVFLMAGFFRDTEIKTQLVFVVVRGDMEVNEHKLAALLQAQELRAATEEEILAVGAVPGYASPIGLENVILVVDDLISVSPNLVTGANEEGFHFINANYGRDFQTKWVADISLAPAGDACPECGNRMQAQPAITLGKVTRLGTDLSEAMDCNFLDRAGKSRPVYLGSYQLGSAQIIASIAEEHHDDFGLIWPVEITPFQVHLVVLSGKKRDEQVVETAIQLDRQLQADGFDVLLDDRVETPGVKFNDADLIGAPIRLTVSQRNLKQNCIELKRRDQPGKHLVPHDTIVKRVAAELIESVAQTD